MILKTAGTSPVHSRAISGTLPIKAFAFSTLALLALMIAMALPWESPLGLLCAAFLFMVGTTTALAQSMGQDYGRQITEEFGR